MTHWNGKLRAWMPGPSPRVMVLGLVVACCVLFMAAVTQIDVTQQVKGILPVGNGGTNTASTLTGVVRGGASYTASELSGDCTTSGSNFITCQKDNGTTVPVNSAADQVLGTSASAVGVWMTVPNCTGALQYSTTTHTFSCGAVLTGSFADDETPAGTINGATTSFVLAHTPAGTSLSLYKNGQKLEPGAGNDYTLATATLTMAVAPKTGDTLVAYYRF